MAELRYRAFWIALDLCAVTYLAIMSYFWGIRFFIPVETHEAIRIYFVIPHYILWPVAMVAIFARPLRDEFAERLWLMTARQLAFVVLLGPILAYVLAASFEDDLLAHAEAGGRFFFSSPESDTAPVPFIELVGALKLLFLSVFHMPLVFLTMFWINKWRES